MTFFEYNSGEKSTTSTTPQKREATKPKAEESQIQETVTQDDSTEWESDDDFIVLEQLGTPLKRTCGRGRATYTTNKTIPFQDTFVKTRANEDSLHKPLYVTLNAMTIYKQCRLSLYSQRK